MVCALCITATAGGLGQLVAQTMMTMMLIMLTMVMMEVNWLLKHEDDHHHRVLTLALPHQDQFG